MKASEIEDCDNCPLLDSHCKGGMTSSPGGEPIEPPCVRWEPDTDLDEYVNEIEASVYAREEEIDRIYKKEQEDKRKQEIKNQRARESRWHVREETRQIKRLNNRIRGNQRLMSLANAFSTVNSMMNIDDKRPDSTKSAFEIKNEQLKIKIDEIIIIKKQKLKELREKRK